MVISWGIPPHQKFERADLPRSGPPSSVRKMRLIKILKKSKFQKGEISWQGKQSQCR
nr:MAG TPA: hypothetical protein [Caudoviricetes sp.]